MIWTVVSPVPNDPYTTTFNMNMEHSKILILSDFTYEEIINMEHSKNSNI